MNGKTPACIQNSVNRTGKLRKQSYLCNSVIKLNSGRNIELEMNNHLSLICFENKDFSSRSSMIVRMREVLKKKSLVEMIDAFTT